MNEMQYFQGDVMFRSVPVREIGNNAQVSQQVNGRYVIARGERTGHTHTIDAETATLYDDVVIEGGWASARYLSGTGTTLLHVEFLSYVTHDEHPPLELPAGDYEVVTQRRYVPQATLRIRD